MKSRIALAVLAAVAVIAPAVAQAQMKYEASRWWDDRWYVTPFGSYVLPDGDRKGKDGWGYGLSIGKAVTPAWNLELRGQYETLDPDGINGAQWKNWTLGLDAQWFFMGRESYERRHDLQPYLILGMGAIRDKAASQTKTSFMADAGLGVLWPLADWGRLFVDGRYRYDNNHGDLVTGSGFNDWVFSAGLQIPLGRMPEVAAPVRAAPPPVVAAPPPPPPAPPPPPPPMARKFELAADTLFAFNSAKLNDAGRGQIDAMLGDLKSAGLTSLNSIAVVGYSDPIGSDAYNLKLSQERANAVRDYLVERGVPAAAITTEGRGKADPKVSEADCAAQGKGRPRSVLITCLAPDRRVEINASGTQAPAP